MFGTAKPNPKKIKTDLLPGIPIILADDTTEDSWHVNPEWLATAPGEWRQYNTKCGPTITLNGYGGENTVLIFESGMQSGISHLMVIATSVDGWIGSWQAAVRWKDVPEKLNELVAFAVEHTGEKPDNVERPVIKRAG